MTDLGRSRNHKLQNLTLIRGRKKRVVFFGMTDFPIEDLRLTDPLHVVQRQDRSLPSRYY